MIKRGYFDRYINGVEIPTKEQQNLVALLTSSDDVMTTNERIGDILTQLEKELTAGYDKIENMTGYEARNLWTNLQFVFSNNQNKKEMIETRLVEYDNEKISKDMFLDYLTFELRV